MNVRNVYFKCSCIWIIKWRWYLLSIKAPSEQDIELNIIYLSILCGVTACSARSTVLRDLFPNCNTLWEGYKRINSTKSPASGAVNVS